MTNSSTTERKSPLREKSYSFALDIVLFCRLLMANKKEYILSKQLMRAGTSIGANIEEAIQGQSRKDFISKMSIASKEAYESRYWLRLVRDSGYATQEQVENHLNLIHEIISMLVATIKTSKDIKTNN